MASRVAVTGLGIFSPLGKKIESFWDRLIFGEAAFRPIHCFSKANELKAGGYVFPEKTNTNPRLFEWIHVVIEQAMQDAQLTRSPAKWLGALHPFLHHPLERSLISWLAELTKKYRNRQHPLLINGACAAGNLALGYAADLIRYQQCSSVIIFGGNEVNEVIYQGFSSLQILSKQAVTPFSKSRTGMGLGEGAVAILLENAEEAKKRGAQIYGYIKGWSSALDGQSTTGFTESAYGPTAALWWALQDAKLNPGEIDWICAHGTGTQLNDQVETKAIKQIFREAAYQVPVTSNKGQVGHLLEGAGLINAVVALMAIKKQVIPGTYNYQEKDEQCDLNYLPNQSNQARLRHVLSNAYGFGGICSSVVFEKGEEN
ncbi:beta-ketoacyl-[acyl-carrier-protein] synthase family protein [Candidatus Margulisiibacteriota bacterium]